MPACFQPLNLDMGAYGLGVNDKDEDFSDALSNGNWARYEGYALTRKKLIAAGTIDEQQPVLACLDQDPSFQGVFFEAAPRLTTRAMLCDLSKPRLLTLAELASMMGWLSHVSRGSFPFLADGLPHNVTERQARHMLGNGMHLAQVLRFLLFHWLMTDKLGLQGGAINGAAIVQRRSQHLQNRRSGTQV